MPTGYTDYLIKNPDATLSDFAWVCARAMGFCVMQRDDAPDAPVNMDEKPSEFYAESLTEAAAELSRVERLTDAEWDEENKRDIAEAVKREAEADSKSRKTIASYQRMLRMLNGWHPPKELDGMKEFMVSQITESIKFDAPVGDTHPEWRVHKPVHRLEKLTELRKQIAHRQKSWDEEVHRVSERNRYKRLLAESLEPSGELVPT